MIQIEPILCDTAADLIGECDVCDSPHVRAYIAGWYVCANEACAATALKAATEDAERLAARMDVKELA